MVIQAINDDHLLSREALPVFIASELSRRDTATRLALLEEVTDLGLDLMKIAMHDPRLDHNSRLASLSGGVFAEAIRKMKEKYRAAQPVEPGQESK